ncbi:hyaluronidase-like [Hemiscyllium ocellatum]|uniref:hyaluronidase-like n=1 Tax=Hemiscyllium ocellatum TaxID=170820 RepID=UPI00296776D5|nr:hyaluronidase-like [Hemiscyllium ocellatum]XP_060691082.1 hyaluronidase-like [Hemiscyllium ocellatum]
MLISVSAMILIKAVIVLLHACTLTLGQPLKQARSPITTNKPFITVWNAPTEACQSLFGIDLNLGIFDIIANQNDSLIGQNVAIFYDNKLGFYPYYTASGVSVNGGVPQNASLKDHLAKAQVDVEKLIPLKNFSGLSVIDWEAWRPSWIRDWAQKDIYRKKSEELVRTKHPDWPESQVLKQAQTEYEQAARDFMALTLNMAKGLRPGGLWGYYGFPCCYNSVISKNYTGECPDIELERNDHLMWLWRESMALYPSIYLDRKLQSTENALKFVHYRIKEGLRLAQLGANHSLPIFPYARIVYANTTDFLTEIDLVHTIGESAAMGAAGIVLWGNSDYAKSQESCLALKAYINETLGNYIVNVTNAAIICSRLLCTDHGRCVRMNKDTHSYLHLNTDIFRIGVNPSGEGLAFFLQGQTAEKDMKKMAATFHCHCYNGWTGEHCEITNG